MRPSWFKISAILAGLWLVVGSTLWWLESRRPSVEKFLTYLEMQVVAGKSDSERKAIVEAVAVQHMRLNFDDRKEVLVSPELERWWTSLSKPERRDFRVAIFPQAGRIADFYDSLPAGQKTHHFERLRQEVAKTRGGMSQLPAMAVTVIRTFGLKYFFENTLLDENLEPLLWLHEMERRFIWSRGR
jgi:hypothetical protein